MRDKWEQKTSSMIEQKRTKQRWKDQAKKIICPLTLGIEKIHACLNHCILWSTAWSVCPQSQGMLSYSFCMWITRQMERFDTLRMADSENNLILHIRRTSLMIQEISCLDLAWMEWWTPHSTWPVIICILNLPPWLCYKRKYVLLTTLVSGPKQAGNDIDVFLEPLMEDMQKHWEYGVTITTRNLLIYDVLRKCHRLHLSVMLTIFSPWISKLDTRPILLWHFLRFITNGPIILWCFFTFVTDQLTLCDVL
jgi:hypothetical protein